MPHTQTPHLAFPCAHCAQSIKAPAELAGQLCRCPHCRNKVLVPVAGSVTGSQDLATAKLALRANPLKRAGPGLLVSMLVHLAIVGLLALVAVQPHSAGLNVIASFVTELEVSFGEIAPLEMPMESSLDHTLDLSRDTLLPAEILSSSLAISAPEISAPVVTDRVGNGTGQAKVGPGSAKAGSGTGGSTAGFSATTAARLKSTPTAKKGDYEIALVWDGPSDLDLHVLYNSVSGKSTRAIIFLFRGTPTQGFLDVDRNVLPPYFNDPIEHIRWNTKSPPAGTYDVFVHAFALRNATAGPLTGSIPYTIEAKTPEGVETHNGVISPGEFESVCSIQIGGTKVPRNQDALAQQLLDQARDELSKPDERTQAVGRGKLKSIVKKYLATAAAAEARKHLDD